MDLSTINYSQNNFMSMPSNSALELAQKAGKQSAQIRAATIGALASNTAEFIMRSINEFLETIPENYEAGLQLTSLGQGIKVYLNNLSYYEPHLIVFDSEFIDGSKMRIVQHVTQLNYALIAMPKQKPEEPRRIIGFRCENEDD